MESLDSALTHIEDEMALQPQYESCSICLRNIAKRRHIKGNIRLKHSGSLVSEVIDHIMGQDISELAILCFRCYRLILGIDYHQHEFERLKNSFVQVYRKRSVTVKKVQKPDHSRTLTEYSVCLAAQDKKVDNGTKNSTFTELQSTPSHDDVNQGTFLGYHLQDSDSVVPVENLLSIRSFNSNEVEEVIVNHEFKPLNLAETDFEEPKSSKAQNQIKNSLEKMSTCSKRRKKTKKYEDFEYYTDYSKDLKEIDQSKNSGNFVNLSETKLNDAKKYCTICHKDFASRKDYSNHPCVQMVEKNISYSCKACQKKFSVRQHYLQHINSCYKNAPVKCSMCMVELQSAAYLRRHLAAFHNGSVITQKGSLCDLCGRVFSRKEGLQRHQAKVHGISHGTYQCSKCGQTFHHTSLLMEHLRAHKGYHCTECKKMFTCMSNLTLHKQTFHQNKTLYFCAICDKRWRFHGSYTNHMRKFHGRAQFKCSNCKLLFSAENAFDRHKVACDSALKKKEDTVRNNKPIYEENMNSESFVQVKGMKSDIQDSKVSIENSACNGEVKSTIMQSKINENYFLHSRQGIEMVQTSQSLQISTPSKNRSCIANKYSNLHRMQEMSSNLENQDSPVAKVEDEGIHVPPTNQIEESTLLCQDSNLSCSSEIVLEALDDLSNDCQYVILVEDGSTEEK